MTTVTTKKSMFIYSSIALFGSCMLTMTPYTFIMSISSQPRPWSKHIIHSFIVALFITPDFTSNVHPVVYDNEISSGSSMLTFEHVSDSELLSKCTFSTVILVLWREIYMEYCAIRLWWRIFIGMWYYVFIVLLWLYFKTFRCQ